ncbi:hypothetical protein R9X50_00189300 [Acrodontium crateriforme]|uniref:Enoyl reductase (ER) domain-containing protein n=1 Tax=Acrodontium crateriforme TaxID=150365 RepID=A0AAQ3R868_9PEZI|nr:hypothetical protein R9X50_00189300 [Acrodontium crateriforme]
MDKSQHPAEKVVNQAAWMQKDTTNPLIVSEAEMPVPNDEDIIIRNHAVAINPVDWKIQAYPSFIGTFPFILGEDVAGEVFQLGKNVTKFKQGDRVIAYVEDGSISLTLGSLTWWVGRSHLNQLLTQKTPDGGFQLYSRTPAIRAAKIPASLSYVDGSVIPLALNTAAHGLYGTGEGFLALPWPSLQPVDSGKTILVWGGSSSVGALAIQLAVGSGVKIVAVASGRNHAFVRSLGACDVVDYNASNVVEKILKAVTSAGGAFAGIYDAISTAASFQYVLPVAEKLGTGNIAIVNPPPTSSVPSHIKFGNVIAVNDVSGPLWESYIPAALEQGQLRPAPEALVIGEGLESIQKGIDMSKAGVSARKVVVQL